MTTLTAAPLTTLATKTLPTGATLTATLKRDARGWFFDGPNTGSLNFTRVKSRVVLEDRMADRGWTLTDLPLALAA